jgi:hypothetical protein
VIEDAVMRHLFESFGNPAAVARAIAEATPNTDKIQEAVQRLECVTVDLSKLERSRQRILDLVVKGTIEDASANTQLEKLKEREQKLTEQRTRLEDELAHVPSRAAIAGVAKQISGQFKVYASAKVWAKKVHANTAFDEMPYDERRQLCQMVFSGKTAEGKRMGVWVAWSPNGKRWTYRIEGHLIDASGPLGKGCFEFDSEPVDQKALVGKFAQRWL